MSSIININSGESLHSNQTHQGVENLSFSLLEPTLKAKIVADECIKHLSTPAMPLDMNGAVDELVTEADSEQIKRLIAPAIAGDTVDEKTLKMQGFVLIGQGSHYSVWAHADYPRVAFKFMSLEAAKTQVEGAKRVREASRGNYWLKAPLSTYLEVNGRVVYMEERLPLGLKPDEQKEVWTRVIQYYHSADSSDMFKNNFTSVIKSMIIVVMGSGFWDIGYNNFPEISLDGRHFCAVDFENLDENNIREGLERVSRLVPFEPFLSLIRPKIEEEAPGLLAKEEDEHLFYAKLGVKTPVPSIKNIMSKFDDSMALKLQEANDLTERLNFYDANGVVTGNENISKPLNIDAYNQLNTIQKGFVDYTLTRIKNHIDQNKDKSLTASRKREITFCPFSYKIIPPNTEDMTESEIKKYCQNVYINSLLFLKEQGVIFSYTEDSSAQPDKIAYNYYIYY